MASRWSVTARIGLGLILVPLAWFGGRVWWAETRAWVPLSMPIPLGRGHVRTTPFRIDAASTYEIEIIVGRKGGDDGVPCFALDLECGGRRSAEVAWRLYGGGRELVRGNSEGGGGFGGTDSVGRILGDFAAREGVYVLDLEVSGDGSDLDAGGPRLMVYEAGGARSAAFERVLQAFIVLLTLSLAGASLIVHEVLAERRVRATIQAQAYSLTQPGPHVRDLPLSALPLATPGPEEPAFARGEAPVTRHAHLRWQRKATKGKLIAGLGSFPLVAQILLMVPLFSFMISEVIKPIPQGIKVHLLRPGPAAAASPGIQPLLVQVAAGPRQHGVRVDSKLVAWDELATLLKTELMRRPPEWPVYVEGDPAMDWQYAVQAIDAIEGVGGRVVLLTTWRGR
jgi:biopolymer transport protein ExbD